jgi:hypothetical protein
LLTACIVAAFAGLVAPQNASNAACMVTTSGVVNCGAFFRYSERFAFSQNAMLIYFRIGGFTPHRFAILRSVRPGTFRAATIRASTSGAIRGRPSCLPCALGRRRPARTTSLVRTTRQKRPLPPGEPHCRVPVRERAATALESQDCTELN